ncbi:hypothetical protein SUDANB121_02464 [Nocardiopsis dassonvillei]|uniref:hypothetical protein n=1 Tax=Nocardiopsis dassonvillei TaxID=2014 RepID=UPI003F552510
MSRRRKRPRGGSGGPRPEPPSRPAREVLRAQAGELRKLLSFREALTLGAYALGFAAVLGTLTFAFTPWVGRWFAVVPQPGRIVAVEEGNPVVVVDGGSGEPLRVVAHGSHTPGEPLEVSVRHPPFVPEASVMGDHVPLGFLVALAVLLCLAVLAVWAPKGLRASWLRRRRAHPRRGRVQGAELLVPVSLRAGGAAACLTAGVAAGVFGSALGGVSTGWAVTGPLLLVCLAWLLVPAGALLAVHALYRYAERAPVRVRPPARVRVLPRGVVLVLRAAALVIGLVGGVVALVGVRPPAAPAETGTAEVTAVWTAESRSGECLGRALAEYTVAELPYRTTLEVGCEDLPVLEAVGEISVRWSAAAPEHVRWVP